MVKIILTGATGMVGEGVLHQCLIHPEVEKVLVVGRRSCGFEHSKLEELIISSFSDLSSIEKHLNGYDGCFFCLGTSSVGMGEDDYFKVTYQITLDFASTLCRTNPGLTFCYVSGAGTDSSEKGRLMWSRVKGRTENDLMKLPFKAIYNFRPGYLQPVRGMKNTKSFYKYISWLYPLLNRIWPDFFGSLEELGLAMINSVLKGYRNQVLEVKDISELAHADK